MKFYENEKLIRETLENYYKYIFKVVRKHKISKKEMEKFLNMLHRHTWEYWDIPFNDKKLTLKDIDYLNSQH